MSREVRLSDRVKQLSFDPSTNAFSLDSVATGFSPFRDFYEDGDVVFYAATDGTRYEVGSGEYNSDTLTRYPLRSSNISSGPYFVNDASSRKVDAGHTGVWHPLYLTKSSASGMKGFDVAGGKVAPASGVHEHTFSGYPGVTFYMPDMEVAGHRQASTVTKSGENYAASGQPVSFQGVTEVFVTYPGKYSVFTGGGVSGFSEPKKAGIAFWGNEQTLDYDVDIVWSTGTNAIGVSQPSPKYAIDVGNKPSYSLVRASGFIGGGSGVQFSGGQALPQSALKTASGGRQLEPFFRSEVDNQTKTDQVFSLSGLVDERLLFKQQFKGMMLAGPPSGCATVGCDPDFPEFRYLELEDIPDLSSLYVVQQNYFPADEITAGAIAFTNASGKIEFDKEFVFSKLSNNVGINTAIPAATLDVNGNIKSSGNIGASGWVEINKGLSVGGDVVVSGDLDVQGNVTYIDSTQVTVLDKQLELASISGAAKWTDQVLNSGGLILKGKTTAWSTSGDKAFIYSESSGAWYSNQSLLLDLGQKVKFNSGPDISGAYHAGSGLELHNGVAFNVGNLFQVSGEDGTNGYIHQGSILTVSGISGIDTSYTQLHNSGRVTIDPTYMYNTLSGAIIDAATRGRLNLHIGSGDFHTGTPVAGTLDTIQHTEYLSISGHSGVLVHYDASNNDLRLSAQPLSGYFESRVDSLGGGYGNWKVNAVTGGGADIIDSITAGQAVNFSGAKGIVPEYSTTHNLLTMNAAGLSGWATTHVAVTSGNNTYEMDVSGQMLKSAIDAGGFSFTEGSGWTTTHVAVTSGNVFYDSKLYSDASGQVLKGLIDGIDSAAISGWTNTHVSVTSGNILHAAKLYSDVSGISMRLYSDVSGVALSGYVDGVANMASAASPSYGSGLVSQNGIIDFRHDGSGTLKHLRFDDAVRIGDGAAVGSTYISGVDSVHIGYHAGSGSLNEWATSGVFIGTSAGALSSGQQDGIFIGGYAGYKSNYFGTRPDVCDNIGIGRNAARATLANDDAVLIGKNAGIYASGHDSTVAIGVLSVGNSEKAEDLVAIGTNAGGSSSGVFRSNLIGRNAGHGVTDVDSSNMIGYRAGDSSKTDPTIGGNNNFIGINAGADSWYSQYSDFIGRNAGIRASGTTNSIGIGRNALKETYGSDEIIAVGRDSMSFASGELVTAYGYRAGYNSENNTSVQFIGEQAGIHSSGNNICDFIGRLAGWSASGCDQFMAFGESAASQSFENDYSIAIGPTALSSSQRNSQLIGIGYTTGWGAKDTTDCVLIGNGAGVDLGKYGDVDPIYSIGLGRGALKTARSAHSAICIGTNAGASSSGLKYAVAIGYNAGSYNMNLADSTAAAGTTESKSVFIGFNAGYGLSSLNSYPGDYNTIINGETSWANDKSDNVVEIANIIHGKSTPASQYPGVEYKYLALGAQPASEATLSNKTVQIKPATASDVALYLVPHAGGSTDMLQAETANGTAATIVNEAGRLQIPIATYYSSPELYTSNPATGGQIIPRNDGTIALYSSGGQQRTVFCFGGVWKRQIDHLVNL